MGFNVNIPYYRRNASNDYLIQPQSETLINV